jgi:hypothetical protein
MSADNVLGGAPRIHGELLKLGFAVSERTVSRYVPHRLRAPSKTWRTFLANHFGDLILSSTVASCDALSDDDVAGYGYVFSLGPRSVVGRCAGRVQSVGSCPLRSVIPTHRSYRPSPPNARRLWQGPAAVGATSRRPPNANGPPDAAVPRAIKSRT